MTFSGMLLRIFRANLRRYLLFWVCSSFTVMIFFIFTTLYTNPGFMDPDIVDSTISSGLYAPRGAVAFFSVFFIIYAQGAFVKFRKTDFGLFLVLGMTRANIRRMILFENAGIALASILAGLGAGTLEAYAFFYMAVKIIAAGDIPFVLTPESYLYTAAFFTAIYAVVIAANLLLSTRYNIVNLLKESRVRDRSYLQGKAAGLTGIAIIGIAVYDMISHYAASEAVFIRSLCVCLLGVYLLLSSLPGWLTSVLSASPRLYFRNMMFSTDLKHTFGQSKKILFTISILVTVTMFLGTLALFLNSQNLEAAIQGNPDHIVYAEKFGKNDLPEATLNAIVHTGSTPLTSHRVLEYLDEGPFKILSAQNMNDVLHTAYEVAEGQYINLFLIVPNDGYVHDTAEMKSYTVEMKAGNYKLTSQGTDIQMRFSIPILLQGARFLIVNEQDFRKISSDHPLTQGEIHLLNFTDWRKTGAIADRLNAALAQYNKEHTEPWYEDSKLEERIFAAGSRIGDYTTGKHSGAFLLFILTFMGLLFFVSSGVILHFHVMGELEREKVKFGKMNKIGITAREAARMMSGSLRLLFFVPYALGILISSFYVLDILYVEMDELTAPLRIAMWLGAGFLGFQWIFYMIYRGVYIRKMLRFMGLRR